MRELFKNKYRIKSARLADHDYAEDGYYFVTICTHNREMFFGDILNGRMILNDVGKIVADEWQKTEKIRKNVFLDEWVIMPNHIHGILIIDNSNVINANGGINTVIAIPTVETPRRGVSTTNAVNYSMGGGNKPQWKSGVLGAIINQFKGKCTKQIRIQNPNFAWQSRFYDHIIKNEKSLENIRQYIYYNPDKWAIDRNNVENLWM